ncbi:aspartyl-phosphate phosphatase Spo0E family protein [Radiobacillus deserti]|uniref:Aspartyl-phosphate phosphatase Spo0E family protein n=2 Tax=Radiobacillus deserti TaxID=2594883 RepID=A0A516KL17_9BACI|nr:aspartyl-phosphate phosphatase Spo0E family protein [Radiobacillus deserti]
MKQPTLTEDELLKQIEQLQNEMIQCGIELGLDHPLTIAFSQELDKLILDYQKRK